MRTILVFLHDVAAAVLVWWLAFLLRFNFEVPSLYVQVIYSTLPWVIAVQAAVFWRFGLYVGLWRFASLPDLRRLVGAIGIAALIIPAMFFMMSLLGQVPRSVLVLNPILLLLAMGGSRFLYRSWKDGHLLSLGEVAKEPVVVIGSSQELVSLLRELSLGGRWRAVAVFNDEPGEWGRSILGVPVLGSPTLLPELVESLEVGTAIVAMPSASAGNRRRATELAVSVGLQVMTVPSYDDLLAGRVGISHLRKVELEDLLGREAVSLDDAGLHELLTGNVVLVSGAGGSIGSELCRQIARFEPKRLVLLEASEFALYRIDEELALAFPELPRSCWAGDVRDRERMQELLGVESPAVLFHAAAYKHVPLMEHANAWQAVRTNALGTLTLAAAAKQAQVKKFVLISTDKAVNPTNVMGASKRLAERLCRMLQDDTGTRFVTVRFGNVLGSNGSVIPKFREQIARGGPVTVTHPDIVRYFMTIPEAAQLVLQAGWMGQGGEIFVLDMGEAIKIVDLAKDMIRLSGFREEDIRIEFSGLRPGEKLYEELLADDETSLTTPHPKLRIAKLNDSMGDGEFSEIREWLAANVREAESVKIGLAKFVPEYKRG